MSVSFHISLGHLLAKFSHPLPRAVLTPLVSQHRIHRPIAETSIDKFDLAMDTFEGESQAFGHGAAAFVLDVAIDLDPVQLPDLKKIVDQDSAAASDHAAALVWLGDPIADVGRAVGGVEVMETDRTDRLFINQNNGVEATVLGKFGKRPLYPFFCRIDRIIVNCPRHPGLQVVEVLANNGRDPRDSILLVTGRISGELAFKAARANIALVATPSVPSSIAAEIASATGMTIVGRAVSGQPQIHRS